MVCHEIAALKTNAVCCNSISHCWQCVSVCVCVCLGTVCASQVQCVLCILYTIWSSSIFMKKYATIFLYLRSGNPNTLCITFGAHKYYARMPGDSGSVVVGYAGCLMLKHSAPAICGYCRCISFVQEPRISYRALFFIWLQQCWCGCLFFDWLWISFFFLCFFFFCFRHNNTNNCGGYGSKIFFDISAFPILGVFFVLSRMLFSANSFFVSSVFFFSVCVFFLCYFTIST